MGKATRTGARTIRLSLVLVLATALAAAWWYLEQEPAPIATPPAAPGVATAPAGPAAPPPVSGPEALPAEVAEAAPTTESDPPQARNGVSWGRMAGLHTTRDELRLRASAAYVVEPRTGKVLVRKNDETVLPIASLTKLMTALVVLDAKLPLHEEITITEQDVDTERNSRSRLRVGTTLPRAEALRLALMSSENRAAHALGRAYPGGLDAFVAAMNRKARVLGMVRTTFVDPTGLSNRNQSTAHDVALLATAASRQPLVREYSTTPQHLVLLGKRTLRFNNSNRLVKSPYWDINLQKTGYIVEAGQCLAMNATVAGRDLVLVLLDSADKRSRLEDAERIRQFAGGEAPPPVRKVARQGKDQQQAKGAAKGQRQAKAGGKQRVAQGQRSRGDNRVQRTFPSKQAAGRKKDGDG
ncbi:serine hydrolase [Ramlibacter lithotrophicus]|uniref:serine hydrolase n=1 Tax=Ramlibacter lithotrophicus TaxID=2606681 RepID=UPI001EE221BD|nr:serine hydrolase [Ramlibacter lithotrophicus]